MLSPTLILPSHIRDIDQKAMVDIFEIFLLTSTATMSGSEITLLSRDSFDCDWQSDPHEMIASLGFQEIEVGDVCIPGSDGMLSPQFNVLSNAEVFHHHWKS